MHRLKLLLPLLAVLGCLAYLARAQVFGPGEARPDPRRMVASGGLLLDVRTAGEYADGHLPNAVNIPHGELGDRLAEVGPRDRPVVVYCARGTRSRWATEALRAAGYTAVFDLGPMSAWPSD